MENKAVVNEVQRFDTCVIGSGPAGCTATMYASRANRTTLQLEGSFGNIGGQLITTHIVENFPGFPQGIDGFDLVQNFRSQAKRFGAVIKQEDVTEIQKLQSGYFQIRTNKNTYTTKTVIFATGAKAKHLSFPNAVMYWNQGISACAVCDGALPRYRNKPIAVVGGGDSAMEEAIFLSKYASTVYIIHRRDKFRASRILQDRIARTANIKVIWNTEIKNAYGNEQDGLMYLELADMNGDTTKLDVSGLFYAIGHDPQSQLVTSLVETKEGGFVVTGKNQHFPTMTSQQGIFACGDVQDNMYRQAITAAGSGCQAALDMDRFLQ